MDGKIHSFIPQEIISSTKVFFPHLCSFLKENHKSFGLAQGYWKRWSEAWSKPFGLSQIPAQDDFLFWNAMRYALSVILCDSFRI